MSISSDAQDATGFMVLLLREITETRAQAMVNEALLRRLLERQGESAPEIHRLVSRVRDEATAETARTFAARLRDAFPGLPPEAFRSL